MSDLPIIGAQRQQQLQDTIALSKNMLETAERGDWEGIIELEKQRREGMMAGLKEPVAVDEAEGVNDSLQTLMQLNDQLTGLVQRARSDSAQQFAALQNGRSAASAYQSVSKQG
ncbi:hypothetical protein A9Q88_06345 [Gammaproteobacteria bacterium 50_400_T64]|nr:hypothetical protein A9Q88_06345 [Gammaproteobacteria bacterium 50_400_T64]